MYIYLKAFFKKWALPVLSFKFKNFSFNLTTMPLKITTSKKPLPVAKRSSLRNRSYEVEPASGRKVMRCT